MTQIARLISAIIREAALECAACGKRMSPDFKFCPYCGEPGKGSMHDADDAGPMLPGVANKRSAQEYLDTLSAFMQAEWDERKERRMKSELESFVPAKKRVAAMKAYDAIIADANSIAQDFEEMQGMSRWDGQKDRAEGRHERRFNKNFDKFIIWLEKYAGVKLPSAK